MKKYLGYIISFYFIIRGVMYLADRNPFGWLFMIVGVGGLGYKIYSNTQEEEE
jgi:hypothetical protein